MSVALKMMSLCYILLRDAKATDGKKNTSGGLRLMSLRDPDEIPKAKLGSGIRLKQGSRPADK